VPLTGQAYEYFIDPVFQSNERYNSNLFMHPTPKQGNWISTFSPGANFGLRHENGELKSNFTWNELIYDNQSELNVAEQLFSLNYQHKYQRLNWSFAGSYNNQSSINSKATTSDLIYTQVMSKRLNLAPTMTYSLSELNSVSLNYFYSDATYGQDQNNIYLSDYTSQQASSSLSHIYSERDTFTTSLSGTLYETQPKSTSIPRQTTHNYVGQLGWQHKFSEQLSASVSGGMNYSQSESQWQSQTRGDAQLTPTTITIAPGITIPAYKDSAGNLFQHQRYALVSHTNTSTKNSLGNVFNASIQKSFEQGSISLSGSQSQSPTALGLQTQQVLSVNTAYTISERWNSGFSASYTKSDSPVQTSNSSVQSNNSQSRTGYTLGPNVSYKFTPEINLSLSYSYQQLKYQSNTQASLGNIVQLQFSYQPQTNYQVK
jgi:opacity protein-like surface antigen